MNRFKKLSAALLAVVMAAGVSACGGSSDTPASTVSTSTQAPATQAPTEAPKAADTPATVAPAANEGTETAQVEEPTETQTETPEPAVEEAPFYEAFEGKNLGGREIVFAANWEWFSGETRNEPPADDDANWEDGMSQYENANRVREKYNVTFKSVNIDFDTIAEQLSVSVMANDPFADFLAMQDSNLVSVIAKEFIMPISDFMPANADALNANIVAVTGDQILGDVYTFLPKPRWGGDWNTPFMGVNLDIIAAIGAENPVDLYENGQWTWDKFLEISRMATKRGADGVINQWGFSGNYGWPTMALINSNAAVSFDSSTWKVGLDDPKSVRALNFLQQYVEEGLWYFGDDIWDWSTMTNAYKDGKAAFFYVEPYMSRDFLQEGANFNFAALPYPIGPDNTSGHSFYSKKPYGHMMPRGVKDAGAVYQIYEELLDWFGTDESRMETEESMAGLMQAFPTYDDFVRIQEYDVIGGVVDLAWPIIGSIGTGDDARGLNGVFGAITGGEQTVAQAIETYLQAMQEAADKYLKKRS